LVNHLASNTSVEAKDLMAGINIASGAARQFGLEIEQIAGLVNAFVMLGKQPKKAAEMINALWTGAEDDIALLLENSEVYGKVLDLLADKKKRTNSLEEEFNDRVSTTANQLRLLKNSIAEVGMNLGSAVLPILKPIAEGLKWFIYGNSLEFSSKSNSSIFCSIAYAIPAVITGLSVLKVTTLSLATKAFPLLSLALSAVVGGFRILTAAMISNPIGAVIAAIATGATLIITNWQKVKNFFSSIWEYIKSIVKPIGEMFSWMGGTVGSIFGKVAENSPLKEFEKRKSIAEIHTPLKSSISNNLLNNSAIKEMSERSKNNVKIKSVIEEKKSIEDNQIDKAFEKSRFEKKELKTYNQTFHQTFNINVKAEPNQDARSIADAVIERFREQARGALFDTVEEIH
ncbi:phage tail tape measure protein, partial [Trichonephila clavata]